ncbi:MAG: FlgD immunoglobulin-like domain containing protein, partial [Calditrichia bacterium]
AYDASTDLFWTVNFGGSLYAFDRSGNVIQQFANPASSYGAAWAPYSDGGPYIWLNSGTTTGDTHHMDQVDPATGQLTGVSITGIAAKIAGGLDIAGGLTNYPGQAVMMAIGQTDVLSLWDLDAAAGGSSQMMKMLEPTAGVIAPGDNTDLMIRMFGVDPAQRDTMLTEYVSIESNDPVNPVVVVEVNDSVVTAIGDPQQLPTTFDISQNYPNPFNPSTSLKFQVPQVSEVKLIIYNVLGQKVRTLVNSRYEPGRYAATWDGRNDLGKQVASGVYIYRFQAGDFIRTHKMMLMK